MLFTLRRTWQRQTVHTSSPATPTPAPSPRCILFSPPHLPPPRSLSLSQSLARPRASGLRFTPPDSLPGALPLLFQIHPSCCNVEQAGTERNFMFNVRFGVEACRRDCTSKGIHVELVTAAVLFLGGTSVPHVFPYCRQHVCHGFELARCLAGLKHPSLIYVPCTPVAIGVPARRIVNSPTVHGA